MLTELRSFSFKTAQHRTRNDLRHHSPEMPPKAALPWQTQEQDVGEQCILLDVAKRKVAKWGKLLHCPKAGHCKEAVGV